MAEHLDVPGMGLFGGGSELLGGGSGGDMVLSAIEEAEEEDQRFQQRESGAALPTIADTRRTGGSSAQAQAAAAAVPDPVGTLANPAPPPGGRPPGYAVGTQPFSAGAGSPSAAAASLLASLGAAAGAGFYFKDPKAAAAGFLVTGSALNLYHGSAATKNPNPAVATEGTWSMAASAIGLGLGAYLAYGVYKGSK